MSMVTMQTNRDLDGGKGDVVTVPYAVLNGCDGASSGTSQ
jgi:hypothetical protein